MFKELWFLENPIETKLGTLRFIKVREYEKLLILSSILQTNKNEVIKFIEDNNPPSEETNQFIEELKITSYVDIIKYFKQLGMHDNYTDLFNFCFENAGSFDLIENDEELNFYVSLIKEMNHLEFEKPSINPELEYFNKLEQIAKQRNGEIITFKSLVMNVGLYKNNVLDISIYSLHEYFNVLVNNKNYSTGTLFQTVSSEKMKIIPWYADLTVKEITLNENDKNFIGTHLNMVRDSPEKKGVIDKL